MADFASYKEHEDLNLQVINLDHVGQIETTNHKTSDNSFVAYIIFKRFVEGPVRLGTAGGEWIDAAQFDGELTRWSFQCEGSEAQFKKVIQRRDDVLTQLVKGKRVFTFEEDEGNSAQTLANLL